MKMTRVVAGMVVGGIVTLGAMAPAGAADFGPALDVGGKVSGPGGAVNALPTPYTVQVLKLPVPGIATVKVGGTAYAPSNGSVGSLLADPLPLKVCALCHPAGELPT